MVAAKLDRVRKPTRRRASVLPPIERSVRRRRELGERVARGSPVAGSRSPANAAAGESYRRSALRARVLPSHCTSCTMTTMTSTTIAVTAQSYC